MRLQHFNQMIGKTISLHVLECRTLIKTVHHWSLLSGCTYLETEYQKSEREGKLMVRIICRPNEQHIFSVLQNDPFNRETINIGNQDS